MSLSLSPAINPSNNNQLQEDRAFYAQLTYTLQQLQDTLDNGIEARTYYKGNNGVEQQIKKENQINRIIRRR